MLVPCARCGSPVAASNVVCVSCWLGLERSGNVGTPLQPIPNPFTGELPAYAESAGPERERCALTDDERHRSDVLLASVFGVEA